MAGKGHFSIAARVLGLALGAFGAGPLQAQYLQYSGVYPLPPGFIAPPRGVSGDTWADTILGQIDFGDIMPNRVVNNRDCFSAGVLVDAVHNRLFLYDCADNRVLVFNNTDSFQPNLAANQTGYAADAVLGQPDFNHGGCNWDGNEQDIALTGQETAPTERTLCGMPEHQPSPQEGGSDANMAVDSQGNLYVPDMWNNRVLRYNAPFSNAQAAVAVWGQADFNHRLINRGAGTPSNDSLCLTNEGATSFEAGVAIDALGNLWVADNGNNRVLRFPQTSGGIQAAQADLVLGQTDFNSNQHVAALTDAAGLGYPTAVRVDSLNNVYVTDSPVNGQGRLLVYANPLVNGAAATPMTDPLLIDPIGLELDAPPAQGGTGGIWVSDAGGGYVVNFLNGVRQKILFRDTFANALLYPGCTQEPGVVGDNGNSPFFYAYLAGDYHNPWFMCYPNFSVGVDNHGGVYVNGGRQWDGVWRFPGPIPYPTPGQAHSADLDVLKPNQVLPEPYSVQNAAQYGGMVQPEGVAVGWGPGGMAGTARQVIVATYDRLMFWNLPNGYSPGALTNGQDPDGLAGTAAPLSTSNPDILNNQISYGRIREDKDTTQQHLYTLAAIPGNGSAILVFNLPLTPDAQAAITLTSPLPLLGGGTFSWVGLSDLVPDPSDPTGASFWAVTGSDNQVFRVRNPLTHPQVDIVLGQPNATSTSCNTGGFISGGSCTDEHLTAYNFDFPGSLAMDHHGDLYVSDDSFENNGNYRLMRWDKSQLPVTQTTCLFGSPGIPATFIYGTPGNSPYLKGGSGVPNDVTSPTVAVFTADDSVMAVGGLFDPFVQVLSNPRQGDFPVGALSDFNSQPYSGALDDEGNYYTVDPNRNRLLIYSQPFSTPFASPTPTATATPDCCQPVWSQQGQSASVSLYGTGSLAVGPATIYVTDFNNGRIQEFLPNGTPAGILPGFDHPYGLALGPNGTLAVGEFFNGDVKLVDLSTNAALQTIPVGGDTRGLMIDPLNGDLYVATGFNSGNGQVSVFTWGGVNSYNTTAFTVVTNGLETQPTGLAQVSGGGAATLLVADAQASNVLEYLQGPAHTYSYLGSQSQNVPAGPAQMAVGANGSLLIGGGGSGALQILDANFNLIHTCSPGLFQSGVGLDASGNIYLVGCNGGSACALDKLPGCGTTPNFSPTATPTPTPGLTPTATPTLTQTPSPSPTFSPTMTPTVTITPTPTATPEVLRIYPNPCRGDHTHLQIPLRSNGDVRVQIFTVACRKILDHDFGPQTAPQVVLDLPLQDQWGRPLANGLYFVAVATAQGRQILKLLVLR